MRLVERHVIKKIDSCYEECKRVCSLSKNLYNRALYEVRQEYIKNKHYLNYYAINKKCIKEKLPEYTSLPTRISNQTLMSLDKAWVSFFALCKLVKNRQYDSKRVKLPKYLKKDGLYPAIYDITAISKPKLIKRIVKLSQTDIEVKTDKQNIKQVRVIPKYGRFIIEVVYEIKEKELLEDNGKYAGIDLGLNNLMTVGFNFRKGFIINGKPLKSINQYFNKQTAREKSLLPNNIYTSDKLEKLYMKRDNKVENYLHKASRYIINQLVSYDVHTLIIGHNKNWKQEINIGKVNNQSFVSVPFNKLIHMLTYKARLKGINVIETEESYTSKCSFMDNEKIEKHDEYLGKRVKRGLFRTSLGKLINADLNGALNIIRKVVGEFQYPIEVCSAPIKINIIENRKLC